MGQGSELIYLYGFLGADAPEPAATELDGMAGAAVRVHEAAGLRVAISAVPEDDYSVGRIEGQLDDLDWVARQGLAHERVVSWFVDHGDIVPVALFTLYSGLDALERDMAGRGPQARGHLERLAGQREWDLKLVCDAGRATAALAEASPAMRELDAEIAGAAPGRRFLLERKRQALARDELRRVTSERADALLEALAAHANAVVRLTIPRTTEELPLLLHAALLVPRANESALAHTLDAVLTPLEPLGFAASLTGPWAPYRFVDEDDRALTGRPSPEQRP
jgi:hypothetical protein